jgi:DNA-binding transcriptional MerR regulator
MMTMNNSPEKVSSPEVSSPETKEIILDVPETTADLAATEPTLVVKTESNIIGVELPLADSHIQKVFDFIEEKPILATEQKSQQKAEGAHMPAVLVDQELLQEIASIPDRFGFKIGDVADLLGIKQYVLRYWEQEFDLLNPKKASNNQRLYTKKDVENAFLIRKLLYRDKFSIEGARQALRDVKFAVRKEKDYSSALQKIDKSHSAMATKIKELTKDIQAIKELFL